MPIGGFCGVFGITEKRSINEISIWHSGW